MDTTQESTPETTPSVEPVAKVSEVTPAAPTGVCTAGFDDAPKSATPFYKKYSMQLSIAVAVIIVLGAGGYVYAKNYVHDGIIATIGGKDIYLYPQGGVVAVVNGTKIYRKEFNESVALVEQSATAQGIDLTDATIKSKIQQQALDVLISNSLIHEAAEKAGFSVSDDEVQAKYDELVKQLGTKEELTKRMGEMGLTEEKLRSNIKERVLADKYVQSETDIENLKVSDAEVQEFIKNISTGNTKLPPLDQIRPQIEAQILSQKQQQIYTTLVDKLRAGATIDTKIKI